MRPQLPACLLRLTMGPKPQRPLGRNPQAKTKLVLTGPRVGNSLRVAGGRKGGRVVSLTLPGLSPGKAELLTSGAGPCRGLRPLLGPRGHRLSWSAWHRPSGRQWHQQAARAGMLPASSSSAGSARAGDARRGPVPHCTRGSTRVRQRLLIRWQPGQLLHALRPGGGGPGLPRECPQTAPGQEGRG